MTDHGLSLLDALWPRADASRPASLAEVWDAYRGAREVGASSFVAAVGVAFSADRLGYAFAAGYSAALERLVNEIPVPSALCVTEARGTGPRAIETTLHVAGDAHELSGTKTFVTFGAAAKSLLVAATRGIKRDGKPDLVMVVVPSSRDGIMLKEAAAIPFVPEVTHAEVRFEAVEVSPDECLPGDGYLDYVKPFRTIEDIHVLGAALGYVVGLARRVHAAPSATAELTAALLALRALCEAAPLDPRVHVALHGLYEQATRWLDGPAFAKILADAHEDERGRWYRDRPLLSIASKARKARLEAATTRLA
jgi:alkylation response protein AidB-like acyl-CoA dehydrogenase